MTLLPFDDRDGWLWLDGALVPWREARLHVLSHGLHYASAVFEGERAYAGNIFRLRDHTERLIGSGRMLSFEIPWSADEIDAASQAVLRGERADRRLCPADRVARIGAVGGVGDRHIDPSGDRCVAVAELFRGGADAGDPRGRGGVAAASA